MSGEEWLVSRGFTKAYAPRTWRNGSVEVYYTEGGAWTASVDYTGTRAGLSPEEAIAKAMESAWEYILPTVNAVNKARAILGLPAHG